MIELRATKARLVVLKREYVSSGASKVYEVQFHFSPEWDGLQKLAFFRIGQCEPTAPIFLPLNNRCRIPAEVLYEPGKMLYIGIQGVASDETMPDNLPYFHQEEEGDPTETCPPDGSEPPEEFDPIVLPTIWCQYDIVRRGAQGANGVGVSEALIEMGQIRDQSVDARNQSCACAEVSQEAAEKAMTAAVNPPRPTESDTWEIYDWDAQAYVDTGHPSRGPQGDQGIQGEPGENGSDGLSAYEIAVENGFQGTEEDWLESLRKGPRGPEGPPGKDGRDGVDGKDGKDGEPGRDGRDGRDGVDGKDGKDGVDGAPGKDGVDGVNGQDGRDGLPGKDGKDGEPGAKGDPGEGLPEGGTTGQFLAKASDESFDTEWVDPPEGGGEGLQVFMVKAPIGSIVGWRGTAEDIPEGWHICDGEDGTWDLRGRFILGTSEDHPIGETGGEEEHTLTVAELAQHGHTIGVRANFGTGAHDHDQQNRVACASNQSSSGTNSKPDLVHGMYADGNDVNGGSAHNNMPPYISLIWIQKIGPDETDPYVYEAGDGIEISEDNVISLKLPIKVISQTEYDAMTDEQRDREVLWLVDTQETRKRLSRSTPRYVLYYHGESVGGGGGFSGTSYTVDAPLGTVMYWTGDEDSIPEGWSICDGQNGTIDLGGKFILGASEDHPVGETGGEEEHTLTKAEMPTHSHDYTLRWEAPASGSLEPPGASALGTKQVGYTHNAGGSQPHNNMPPYTVLIPIQRTSIPEDSSDGTPSDIDLSNYVTKEEFDEALGDISSALDGILGGVGLSIPYMLPLPDDGHDTIVTNGDIMVAPMSSGRYFAYSYDSVQWTKKDVAVNGTWKAVCYGGGLFVALASSSAVCMYSEDGINWNTATNLPVSAPWTDIAYGDGYFVAISTSGGIAVRSTDGNTWVKTGMSRVLAWKSICYGDGKFVAIAPSTYMVDISYNGGATWVDAAIKDESGNNVQTAWDKVVYGNGVFVATVSGGKTIAWSEDAVDWHIVSLATSCTGGTLVYGEGMFFCSEDSGRVRACSVDGKTWHYLPRRISDFYSVGGCYFKSNLILPSTQTGLIELISTSYLKEALENAAE